MKKKKNEYIEFVLDYYNFLKDLKTAINATIPEKGNLLTRIYRYFFSCRFREKLDKYYTDFKLKNDNILSSRYDKLLNSYEDIKIDLLEIEYSEDEFMTPIIKIKKFIEFLDFATFHFYYSIEKEYFSANIDNIKNTSELTYKFENKEFFIEFKQNKIYESNVSSGLVNFLENDPNIEKKTEDLIYIGYYYDLNSDIKRIKEIKLLENSVMCILELPKNDKLIIDTEIKIINKFIYSEFCKIMQYILYTLFDESNYNKMMGVMMNYDQRLFESWTDNPK